MYNKRALNVDLGKFTKPDPYKDDILYTEQGQWQFPGQPTRIPSNDITMEGVPYPVYGIDNTGYEQMMYPGEDYTFPGDYVDEYPMAKRGGYMQSLPKKKSSKRYSRSLTATNKLFTKNPFFKNTRSKKNRVFDPNAKYYQDGGALPEDYSQFINFAQTLPSNLQDPEYQYGNPDQYNLYGMWETVGKPQSFKDVQDSDYFPLQDDGEYHGFTVGSDGEFLKPMSHSTTWKEVMNSELNTNPYFKENRLIKNEQGRLQYVPNKQKGGVNSPVQLTSYYSFDQSESPEAWATEIKNLERQIGNPVQWTNEDYELMQNKLNDYQTWRKQHPEVRDLSNKPNEYVVPLPYHLRKKQKGGFNDDINKRRQVLRDWTYGKSIGMLQEPDGGYIELDLSDAEIDQYRKGGYIVEDISIPTLTKAEYGMPMGTGMSQNYMGNTRTFYQTGGRTLPKPRAKNYDPLYTVKPQVAESTARNIPKQDSKVVEKELAKRQAERKVVAQKVKANPLLTQEQKNEILLDSKKLDENVNLAYEKGPDTIKQVDPQSASSRAWDYVTNPFTALEYEISGGGAENMPRNINEMRMAGIDPGVVAGRNAVGNTLNTFTNLIDAGDKVVRNVGEGNYGTAALEALRFVPGARLSTGLGKQAGRYLTTQTPLRNAYNYNPLAGRLGEYNRVVGQDAVDDIVESGLVRVNENAGVAQDLGPFGTVNRTTPYPSFGKAKPQQTYANQVISQGKTPYIISTDRPMKASTLGRHGKGKTQFPVDEAGKYMTGFPASEAKVYEFGDPHWLKGYKGVSIPPQEMIDLWRIQEKGARPMAELAAEGKLGPMFQNEKAIQHFKDREKYFGQWFTKDKNDFDFYRTDREFIDPEIIQLKVPKNKLQEFQNYDKSLSRASDREFVIPSEQQELYRASNTPVRSGIGGMDMSRYEIKNPDYFKQLLDTYDSKALSASNKKFYKDLIASVKKQNGLVTERQYNELQRLKTGNFDFGKKAYQEGGPIELELTPEEIDWYISQGYEVEDLN